MTLQDITAQLTGMGFKARSATVFQLGNVDVQIKDAFLPPEIAAKHPPFFQVTVYGEGNEHCAVFTCPIDSFQVFKNSAL